MVGTIGWLADPIKTARTGRHRPTTAQPPSTAPQPQPPTQSDPVPESAPVRAAARAFFTHTLRYGLAPVEVTTDRAPVYPRRIADVVPAARHVLQRYSNNAAEADHGRLKARIRPMRGIKTIRSLRTIAAGHAFVQDLRRGHYEFAVEVPVHDPVRVASVELAPCL